MSSYHGKLVFAALRLPAVVGLCERKNKIMNKNDIVFSTDPEWQEKCPVCDELVDLCVCKSDGDKKVSLSVVLIGREKKGRRGKTVTIVSGIHQNPKVVQKELQQLCGAGGTIKNGMIEIQGDHREKIHDFLQQKGYTAKLTGG